MGERASNLGELGGEFNWSLLDAVPDGVVVAATSGEVVYANDQAVSMFAASATDLVGIDVDELLPIELRGAHRAHRTRYRAHPEVRSMGAGLTLRARRLDGSEFDTEISLSPLRLGEELHVLAAVRDVSDRVVAEDHLRRVLTTLDSSDDAVVMFNVDNLRYEYVNEGAVRLVGYDRAELRNMTPLDLNPYAAETEYRELVDRMLADPDEHVHRSGRLLRKDGTEVPVEKTYRAGPPARDGSRWIIASARDVSDRLAAEAKIREHEIALRETEQHMLLAEDRDRIARDLHDTVIQRLFGTGLAIQSVLAITDGTARDRLEQSIDDLDETIRELRSAIFSLQTRSARPLATGVRERVLAIVDEVQDATGVKVQPEFAGAIESVDPRIVEQLLPTVREALTNVAKHAAAEQASLCLVVDNRQVTLTVTDDGVGVTGEFSGGHGLANMAVRASRLGGDAELRSEPRGGAVLRWSVPMGDPTSTT
jgi:PAS domain S-box-containing protein